MLKQQLKIIVLRNKFQTFHFFGLLGYIVGTLLGARIVKPLGLRSEIVLLMTATGAGTCFLLAFAVKWISGEEAIGYYHHEIAILVLCALLLCLLGLPVLPYLDSTFLGIGAFPCFCRLGCYPVGCCHGRSHKHDVKYSQQHVDAGFTLSCGTRNINSEKQQHHTFSLKNKRVINRQAANKMAEIISMLTNHNNKYELIEKQNGIYHILFLEPE